MRAASAILLFGALALALPARAEQEAVPESAGAAQESKPAGKTGSAKKSDTAKKTRPTKKAGAAERASTAKKPDSAKKTDPAEATPAGARQLAPGAKGAEPAPDTTPTGALRLDLTPARLFGKDPNLAGDRRGAERHRGLLLGDDRDWKVQAAQIGAMAAGFAALVGLCGGGDCRLPSVFGEREIGAPPDLQIRKPAKVRSAR